MDTLGQICNLIFHVYMLFILAYSGMAIFALLRFGRSRLLGIAITVLYVVLISGLYYQGLNALSAL